MDPHEDKPLVSHNDIESHGNDKQLIERLLREKEISTKYNNDLRHELSILSAKLHLHQKVITKDTISVETQTELSLMSPYVTNNSSVCGKCCHAITSCGDVNSDVINDWKQNSETKNTRISDLVRETAQEVVTNNDFQNDYVYDQKSKTYYSRSSGWYYYPDSSLFYDPNTKNYYKYDFDKKVYNFYSSLKQMDKKRQTMNKTSKTSKSEVSPPLMRMIVKQSSSLEIGSLLQVVSCMGAKVGNDSSCDVWITDESVSRSHAEIRYDYNDNNYMIKDLNSTNGTFINGNKIESNCSTIVSHSSEISFGKCVLLVHIHNGKDVTCDRCEPGLVIANLKSSHQNSSNLYEQSDKEKDRKKQLKSLKKKYGLKDNDFCEPKVPIITNSNYKDRAERRRVEKGSDNPYEKTAAGTTLDSALSKSNKGFQMLEKMGWTSGQALGKHENGITEPVNVINGNNKPQPLPQKNS
ncbi:unnamed protein product [Oppiella nova]|uniref:Angiogenic factor with G patch and FHA domains 1 n=1 Tax=Oppiella nova TaxID=334625 RepID=A0A7R9MH62_9ACAR|nr:unnamed protein product [Oppiella nova]CAG2176321.1 unnamed protein product [Oppiella nova]